MVELIGRSVELEEMEKRYSSSGIRTLAIMGRRRIGKTALITEFCRDKPHLILTSIEGSYSASIRSFDYSIDEFLGIKGTESRDFLDIVGRLKKLETGKERLVIVIDEYTYLCESEPACNSFLQIFIDHALQEMNAFLIVSGSLVGIMEDVLMNDEGPLYKRFIGPMKIKELPYYTCREFHQNLSEEDNIRLYSMVGGIPMYHQMMGFDTVEDNVKNSLLGSYSMLREEANYIVMRELNPVSHHLDILRVISEGATSGKEIAEKVGIDDELCHRYLKRMESLNIITKLNPMCGASKKEKIYRVSDNLIRLYGDVILPRITMASNEDRDYAYHSIEESLKQFYGPAFEDICRQYVMKHYRCKEIGSWWGKIVGESTDIDIVALCEENGMEYHLVCECKFRNKQTGLREMKELERRSEYLKNCYNKRFCLFSRMGFTDELEEYAESFGIELVDPKKMFEPWSNGNKQ